MYVSRLDRSWLETNFLFQGFELKTLSDIQEVRNQCDYVFIDLAKQNKSIRLAARNTPYSKGWLEDRKAPASKTSFEQEFSYSELVYSKTSSLVKSFMENASLGKALNVAIAKTAVSECVNSIINSPDALMWLTQLKNKDEYTSQHSMNVCIYSIALGRQLGLSTPELEELGLCGMMHDMGKMQIPLEILNKPGRFEPEELAIMQSHPTRGWKLLISSHGMPGSAIDACYGHHERMDGKGYPRGLTAEQIAPYTRIVTIADIYDALSSDRVYKKGITHLESIKILYQASGDQLDSSLVLKFIESLGIYPPGNIVELSNGEVAVIIETNPVKKLKPKITMLLDENKKRVKPRLVDLAKLDLDANGQPYAIKRILRPGDYDIDLNLLYKMGIVSSSLATA
ncbi:phosphohydrolase [Methyloprofundus sedimenti]|uniref:Phosphohydrolase n=2 Tax=Methyloprofundus sedimenti TaxID=1420851 RepID=A0A1V8MB03_9GAMM|nr:phosphohydrolase [Methyloprofundus sedimenti]